MESLSSHLDQRIWLEDMLGYASDAASLLLTLKAAFEISLKKGLKLNSRKCDFVAANVNFCCPLLDSKSVKFHPRLFEALTSMKTPTPVGALIELLHGANWMRTAIRRFAERIEPLRNSMHKTSVKSKIRCRPLSAWVDEHHAAFTSLIQAIAQQVTLTIPDPVKRLRLFTDASSTHSAGVLAQVNPNEIATYTSLPLEWNHSPVAFRTGSSRGLCSCLTTPKQESYVIVARLLRLSHILAVRGEFSLFTDRKNIPYMLGTMPFNANFARHIVHKTQRRALRLAEFGFTVKYATAAFNSWADLLPRWAAPGIEESPAQRLSALRVPLITEGLPELPSVEVISKSRLASPPLLDAGFTLTSNMGSDIWMTKNCKIYIPEKDYYLQLRICAAVH